ncbi:hypothetical protein BP6252_10282 [Coleophoma cylindrospora]|uniref:Xylanolytic transcriptional activator regulatory domain-containing protein n=1 Tax=Coleophoma cylindrospora TaxID=1849047 RepID=A0A3D8QSG0_9HELO|nr:hypothetical protein BP6252_10282 [Coleophoma cylindrospora]
MLRRKIPAPLNEKLSRQPAPSENSRNTTDQANLLNQEIHCSIAGADASVSSAMHLHYGPSSTFVFLQQLYRFLSGKPGSRQVIINSSSANYTEEAISEFGYSSIFFGRDSEFSSDPSRSASWQQDLSGSNPFSPELLPSDLAETFLESYLSTLHHVLPFCQQKTLRTLFHSLYYASESHTLHSRDFTLILAVLAVGATLTDEKHWANSLFARAKAELDSWGDAIRGRPNSAVLAVGAAAQKALAMGLQHETINSDSPSSELTDSDRSRLQERHASFWSLYVLDRNLSLSIGRPASINDMDVELPDPVGDSHLTASVALSRISHKVYYSVYGRKKGTFAEFCGKIQGLREELSLFHKSLAPENQFPLSQHELRSTLPQINISHMLLAFDFFQIMIITLRPCLILDAVQRRHKAKTNTSPQVIPNEWLSWLDDACLSCSKASIHIIRLFARAIDQNQLVSRIRHSRFYLENACLVLLFDALRDPSRKGLAENFQAVTDCLQCFARMPADELLAISTSAISRMLQLTKNMVARPGDDDNQERNQFATSLVEPIAAVPTAFGSSAALNLTPGPVQMGGDAILDVGNGPAIETIFNDIDFFNADIFDLSYDLWVEYNTLPTTV